MRRERIETAGAPAALGPYSQAIRFAGGAFVFASGQVAIDPATGELVPGGTGAQTRRAIENLRAVLEAAGASLATVVKTTVFRSDLSDFAEMNAVYAEHFPAAPPARSTVEVSRLPKDARVEIEALAVVPSP
jgi:2-iminobutanoate/2-iminopropanoate deaminase